MQVTFHEGLSENPLWDIDAGIFHEPDHLKLQAASGWATFRLCVEGRINGLVHFHLQDSQAVSPLRSPFGSYIFSDAVAETTLFEFVSYCEHQLIGKRIRSVIIKNQPQVYAEKRNQCLVRVLNKSGYDVSNTETSAVIKVSSEPFERGLHKSEKKRLRKCHELGMEFRVLPVARLKEIYTFLEFCRSQKGYSLSMTFEETEKLVRTFPERILLTAVFDQDQIAAANISIRVYNGVLYNFYHDHAANYDLWSPVVRLNQGLYELCQQAGVDILDLGTSQTEGRLNESLLNFKLNLGAQPSPKFTFIKKLG